MLRLYINNWRGKNVTLYKNKYRVKSTRLPHRDYAANGWYFVTICTHNRICYFGNIINRQMQLSPMGEIAKKFWLEIPQHFHHTYLDTYVIMPNHIHGIIVIDNPIGRDVASNVSTSFKFENEPNCDRVMSQMSPKTGSLAAIIRSYKSAVTRECRQKGYDSFRWQSRFYEHIIRQDGSLKQIQEYIVNNPAKWVEDRDNPANLWI
ncbi:MAG: transposase [Kamptonema sp. SIO1D9]|nr:transposase [Kamptonema sp. SIO1D9]